MDTKVSFWKTNIGKTLTAGLYLGVASILTFLVTAIEGDPTLFGTYTPFLNLVLVFVVKTWFDRKTPNVTA